MKKATAKRRTRRRRRPPRRPPRPPRRPRPRKAAGAEGRQRPAEAGRPRQPRSRRSRPSSSAAGGGLLESERATYTRQADTLRAEADALVADFEPGDVQFDEESGEGDTLNVERERDLALSAQARQTVEEIDHALAKFADGTYGICEVSGEPIPKERLKGDPVGPGAGRVQDRGLGRR